MIVRSRYNGDVELRFAGTLGSTQPPPPPGAQYGTTSVSLEGAAAIPALMAAATLVIESIASLPLPVYRGTGGGKSKAEETWQYALLHDLPNLEQSPFDFVHDLCVGLEWAGNAFARKVKGNGRVLELIPIDPARVSCYRDRAGTKRFDIWHAGGREAGLTSAEILHVRGRTLHPGATIGLSPIGLHRAALGVIVDQEQFVGRYFARDARPGLVLAFPGGVTREQAKEWQEHWEETYGGPENSGKVAVVGSGGKLEQIPVSLEDAQFASMRIHSVTEAARIFRVPVELLDGTVGPPSPNVIERFLKFGLLSRLKRIEMAFRADPDLFGLGPLYPEFLLAAFERADVKTRFEAYRTARQGGWISANEIRDKENYPPVAGGDEIQLTPVGGAPNPVNDHDAKEEE